MQLKTMTGEIDNRMCNHFIQKGGNATKSCLNDRAVCLLRMSYKRTKDKIIMQDSI